MNTASEDRDWPGTAPRVPGEGDFEEVLRRALHSVANDLEPTGDGLTQIFRRVAHMTEFPVEDATARCQHACCDDQKSH